jgi:FHA domain-containing protein
MLRRRKPSGTTRTPHLDTYRLMQLIVIEHAGQPVGQDRRTAAVFHPPGGTIGRDHDNHLVLRDDTRQISRLQALLQMEGDACSLKNLSSVATIEVNHAPVPYTQSQSLHNGDLIRIGSYVLRAEAHAPTDAAVEDKADIEGKHAVAQHAAVDEGAPQPQSEKPAKPAKRAGAEATGTRASSPEELRQLSTNPLDLFGVPSGANGSDPFSSIGASAVTQSNHHPDWASHVYLQQVPSPARPVASAPPPPAGGATAAQPPEITHAAAEQPASPDALLRAFLEGTGLDPATHRQLSPEQMLVAGQLLTLFANGTVELLSSRSILKREVKADMTMLLDRENNPLKLLPDGGSVLRQMFGLPFPGFMSPQGAVRDAFQDLHAHQIGMVAGMRAALMDLLARFSPQRLRERDVAPRWYERCVHTLYKARMWDRYVNIHREAVFAIEDDFASVFGKSFLAAYDVEVEGYRGHSRT